MDFHVVWDNINNLYFWDVYFSSPASSAPITNNICSKHFFISMYALSSIDQNKYYIDGKKEYFDVFHRVNKIMIFTKNSQNSTEW